MSVPGRRDFLVFATTAVAGVGAAAVLARLLGSLAPAADVVAAALIEVDVAGLRDAVVVSWRGRPVSVVRRSPAQLAALRALPPAPDARDDPPGVRNWHRSLRPEL